MNPVSDLRARSGLPDALRVLVETYPRAGWQTHRHFDGMVAFWLDRHLMFRRLLGTLEDDTQAFVSRDTQFSTYAPRLSRLGGMLINELHGHHHIEDAHYFPMLARLDPGVEHGFDLLEADHLAIDPLLSDFAAAANSVLQRGEAGPLTDQIGVLSRLLDRHLCDEEDIVVPTILKFGFKG